LDETAMVERAALERFSGCRIYGVRDMNILVTANDAISKRWDSIDAFQTI